MASKSTCTMRLTNRVPPGGGLVFEDSCGGAVDVTSIELPLDAWHSLSRPERLLVTIEPAA